MARKDPNLVALGRQIASLRRELGLKQDAVAEQAGIATKTLSEIERGLGNATFLTLVSIAKALDVGLLELLAPFAVEGAESLSLTQSEQYLAKQVQDLIVNARKYER